MISPVSRESFQGSAAATKGDRHFLPVRGGWWRSCSLLVCTASLGACVGGQGTGEACLGLGLQLIMQAAWRYEVDRAREAFTCKHSQRLWEAASVTTVAKQNADFSDVCTAAEQGDRRA